MAEAEEISAQNDDGSVIKVLIKDEIGCKQCLICGKKINDCEASILLKVGDEVE